MQITVTPLTLTAILAGKKLALDKILLDAFSGLKEDTLQVIAISNVVVLILNPDQQNIQGTEEPL